MKVFIAGFDTETNTFAPLPTGYQSFADCFLAHGNGTSLAPNYCSGQLLVWRKRAEARGWQVVESICTFAEPGGRIVRPAYEKLRDELLGDLKKAMPVDMVVLALHGAAVAEGYDDCEGDILQRIRAIVGDKVPVGAELDLHCHITDTMVREATVLVAYKEYPHTDIPDRADELFTYVADAAEGKTRPVMAAFDCRMIGTFRTTEQPLRDYVDRMYALEGKNGIISVSLGHSFPWGDGADVGVKTLVVADGDRTKAESLARRLGEELFQLREATRPSFLTMDEALDQALAIEGGPVVIADVSDNSGGGATGDATFFIRRVRERGIPNVASCYHWDPMAVRFCQEAGVGASFDLRIGGKCGVSSGDPLDMHITVKGLADDVTQRFGKSPVELGSLAWVSGDGLDIVLATKRSQAFHPEGMTKVGLDPTTRKIVLAKSTQHFHAAFAPIAKKVLYAAAPGTLAPDFATIPYTKLAHPYWPRVADPFKAA